MLLITIELLPSGCADGHGALAIAEIGRIQGGRLGRYAVTLREEPFGLGGGGTAQWLPEV